MKYAVAFSDRHTFFDHILDRISDTGPILEFGVGTGKSIRYIANKTGREIHGFDSFVGLPDDGQLPRSGKNTGMKWFAGHLNYGGALPAVPENVTLHAGWFEDTIGPYLAASAEERIALLHVDCDIYTSARTVLEKTSGRIGPGTIIVFDEYMNYPGWEAHEHRAFQEIADDLAYSHFAYSYKGQVAILIEGDK